MNSFRCRLWMAACCVCASASAQVTEWTCDLEAPAGAPTLYPSESAPKGVVVTSGNSAMLVLGDGSAAWRCDLEGAAATPATVADLDGDGKSEIVLALVDGTIVCLNEDGTERWAHAFDTPAGGFKNLAAADVHPARGLEILGGFDDGWVTCLGATGDALWRFFGDKFRTGGGFAVGDADDDGAPEIVYGTDNGHVYCLDGHGRMKWRYAELAPYGRSGPNLARLRRDEPPLVLIARSNVGNATCLAAIDGVTGKLKWRTQDAMQGYVSNAVVDFEQDGVLEVLHGDKGNHVYCENADGTRRWTAELGGRGVFWAPCAADVDGDGAIEVVVAVRGEDPETGACVYVLDADGKIESALDLGSSANASPAVGDIDGDGELEAVVATDTPPKLHALTWHARGRVAWASMRGDSRMTGATNVSSGRPGRESRFESSGVVFLPVDRVYWGENKWRVSWPACVGEDACVEAAIRGKHMVAESRIVNLKAEAQGVDVPAFVGGRGPIEVAVRLWEKGASTPRFAIVEKMKSLPPERCWIEGVEEHVTRAKEAGKALGVDTQSLDRRLGALRASAAAVHELAGSGASGETVGRRATELRRTAECLVESATHLESHWRSGYREDFACWWDENPWDRFDPEELPSKYSDLPEPPPFAIEAFGGEFEDAALTLRNLTDAPMEIRCTVGAPKALQGMPRSGPDPAGHVTLRRAVPVATQLGDRVFDALPALDGSGTMTLPPNEARQLWVVIDTHGLEPGEYRTALHLESLSKPFGAVEAYVKIVVWPVELPQNVYAKMNWSSFNLGETSDQSVRDMVDHGVSVIYGPPLPSVPVDAQGRLKGPVDWTAFDANLDRVPRHFTMLWSGPPARQWPTDDSHGEESSEYFNGFRTALREMAAHLAEKGFPYRQWAFYPIDEPWNTGFTHVPQLKRFCEMVKRADPQAQNYADPAGHVRVGYLDEFADLIDIWQPEMNLLKRDPALVEWFQTHAKRFWAYEAAGPAKDLLPLGHYRAFAWLAWRFGAEGAGYWVYRGEDAWRPTSDGNYSAVYEGDGEVVPSRRWEADRDGVEDYRALWLLRKEIERARVDGRVEIADGTEAALRRIVDEVVGWQIGTIDEITRMTRDYEIEYDFLVQYRERVAQMIVELRKGSVNR